MKVEPWPVMVGVGLLLVILVNAGMVWVATANAPVVERSYTVDQDR